MKTKPLQHQAEALEKSNGRPAFGYLMEPGTGKTWTALADFEGLRQTDRVDCLFTVAPNGVHRQWIEQQVPEHLGLDGIDTLFWRSTTAKSYLKRLEAMLEVTEGSGKSCRVVALSYDAVRTDKGFQFASLFLRANRCLFVADESTRMKNPTTARSKRMHKLAGLAKYRRILTGTPITKSPFDAHSQFAFLDPSILGPSFTAFKARYAQMLPANSGLVRHVLQRSNPNLKYDAKGYPIGARFIPQVVATDATGRPVYRNLQDLAARIAPYSFRVLKADCLDLPQKQYIRLSYDLDRRSQALHDSIRDEQLLMGDGQIEAISKLVAMGKLAMVTSGHEPLPLNKYKPLYPSIGDNPRFQLVEEILEDHDFENGGLIIWCRFQEDVRQLSIAIATRVRVVTYYGPDDDDARAVALQRFQSRDADVLVGTPAAGGIGLNMTAATGVIFYTNDFNLETRLQAEDRCHRHGQRNVVRYYDLVAADSIDELVVGALVAKKDVADLITGDPYQQWLRSK